jgi:hypothetical protein
MGHDTFGDVEQARLSYPMDLCTSLIWSFLAVCQMLGSNRPWLGYVWGLECGSIERIG